MLGHYSGRVHAKGRIPATGLIRDLEWVVIGNGIEDVSENEMEIWFPPSDEVLVSIKPPDGSWIGPVLPRQAHRNLMLANGTFVSIYNELNDPKNGDNKISLYLSPFMKRKIVGIRPGIWRVRLEGKVIRDGNFHAWIERDIRAALALPGTGAYHHSSATPALKTDRRCLPCRAAPVSSA